MRRKRVSRSAWIGTAGGAALGLAGVAEARKLAAADQPALRRSAASTGPMRVAFGALLLAKPRLLPRSFGGAPGGETAALLTRMVAVREIVVGVGMFRAGRTERDPRPWLLSVAAIDGGEGLVVLHALARRRLPPIPALGFAAADAGGAMVAAGVLVQRRRGRAATTAAPATPSR